LSVRNAEAAQLGAARLEKAGLSCARIFRRTMLVGFVRHQI
jgi:hypothetical protein